MSGPVEIMWLSRVQIASILDTSPAAGDHLVQMVVPYPSLSDVRTLLEENGLWKQFKKQVSHWTVLVWLKVDIFFGYH